MEDDNSKSKETDYPFEKDGTPKTRDKNGKPKTENKCHYSTIST